MHDRESFYRVDWIQLVQDGTDWWVVALVVMNSRWYGMLALAPELLPIPVGTVSCCGEIYDFGWSRIWGLRCWEWEKANPHEGSECLLETGRVLQAIGKR